MSGLSQEVLVRGDLSRGIMVCVGWPELSMRGPCQWCCAIAGPCHWAYGMSGLCREWGRGYGMSGSGNKRYGMGGCAKGMGVIWYG